MALSPTQWVQASINEKGTITGGQSGDQTGKEIGYCSPYHYGTYPNDWDYVLIPPAETETTTTTQPSKADIKQQIINLLNQL